MHKIKFFFRDLYWDLRKRVQRFLRGYAWEDLWNIDAWFIATLEPMLKHLQKYHCGYPIQYTNEEWDERLGRMAELLHYMDEWNVIDELCGGDVTDTEIRKTMDKNRKEFFEMFSEDFYSLWD